MYYLQPSQAASEDENTTAQRYSTGQGNPVNTAGTPAPGMHSIQSETAAAAQSTGYGLGGSITHGEAVEAPVHAPPPLAVSLLDGLLLHLNSSNRPTARAAIEALPRVIVPAVHCHKQPLVDTAVDQSQQQTDAGHCVQQSQQQLEACAQQQEQQAPAEPPQNTYSLFESKQALQISSSSTVQLQAFCVAGEPCTVCHEEFQAGCEVMQLPCKHCFHEVS